jgi:hypothetical protein
MARLRLKDGQTYRSVGHVVVKMAQAVHRDDAKESFDPDPAYDHEEEFQGLFEEPFLDVPAELKTFHEPSMDKDGVMVLFHFDRTHRIEENGTTRTVRVVNIAVPDFEGKTTSQNERNAPSTQEAQKDTFDLTDVAAEAFGFIVICGCVG